MNTAFKPRKRAKFPPKGVMKELALPSDERARMAYNEAIALFRDKLPSPRLKPEEFIQLNGKILRFPAWFPYVPTL